MQGIQIGQPNMGSNTSSDHPSPRSGYVAPPAYKTIETKPLTALDPNPKLEKHVDPLDVQYGGTHYKGFKIQPMEYTMVNGLGYCEGNVIKYVTRHKLKGGKQDLLKAIHFIEMLIKYEYGDQ